MVHLGLHLTCIHTYCCTVGSLPVTVQTYGFRWGVFMRIILQAEGKGNALYTEIVFIEMFLFSPEYSRLPLKYF
jgi:hypothetical protein